MHRSGGSAVAIQCPEQSPAQAVVVFVELQRAYPVDATRRKKLAINVCNAVTLPRATRHKIQPLDREQARRLLKAAK